jgi:hypothetical protein
MPDQDMLKQIERRVSERRERDYQVCYCANGASSEKKDTAQGKLVNISDGGLSFLANEEHARGTELEFVLEVPGLQTNGGLFVTPSDSTDVVLVRINGQVMWAKENKGANKFETGILFTNDLNFKITENE